MKKQVFTTVLESEDVSKVRQGDVMQELIKGFNLSILQGEENIGNISYSQGYIYCNISTNLPADAVKNIIENIVSNIKIDAPEVEKSPEVE